MFKNYIGSLLVRRALFTTLVVSSISVSTTASADVVSDLLGTSFACAFANSTRSNMPVEPLYQNTAGQCMAVVPDGDAGSWYSDDQCLNPIVYTRTSMQQFCAAASNRAELGNGVDIRADSWTLTPGSQLNLGSRSLNGVSQPYMQRLVYRRVQTASGSCDLEMRVYKKHPSAQGQRSMIALHGGSWTSRSFGYLGLELSVSHYVNQGFVVYAPFYRLLDNTDSTSACNEADFNDIVDDANFSLNWVLNNAERFGSVGAPVVFGQSAGGHLALSLAVNQPSQVSGVIAMYPPTDFGDFLQRVKSGAYTNQEGLGVLNRVVGGDADGANLDLPVVLENSFPMRIAQEGNDWPPMFIVQGSSDDLVEARHAVRLCDALAGRVLPEANEEVGIANELREVVLCDEQSTPVSQLHLIREGAHALDVCLNENIADLCPSGSAASRSLISQSITEAATFAVTAHQTSVDEAKARAEAEAEANKQIDSDENGSSEVGAGLDADGAGSTDDNVSVATEVVTKSSGGASFLFFLLLPYFARVRLSQSTRGSIR